MSEDLPNRVAVLERQFAASEARADERLRRERRIEEKVDLLLEDMNLRHGREAANLRKNEESREDRHEMWQWLRAFVPTGIWVAFWSMVVWAAQKIGMGGGQ